MMTGNKYVKCNVMHEFLQVVTLHQNKLGEQSTFVSVHNKTYNISRRRIHEVGEIELSVRRMESKQLLETN